MEAIGQLTGGIAHDFNNLLHAIGINLDLLSRLDCPPQAERVVNVVRRTVKRGARLTEQLLSFARSHSLVPQPTDLHLLVAEMQELLATSVGSSIRVDLQLSHPCPMVQVDRNQLEMAILNLAVNARDAMPRGGSIVISTSEVELPQAGDGARGVRLTLSDSGEGIPPSIIERVFEPFFTTKPMGSGTGLGLAQVYGFVKQSGGDIRIESTPGAGTKVHLLFAQIADALLEDASEMTVPRVTPRQKILVVEDDEDVRLSIVQSLEILGHEVVGVSDAEAALAALEHQTPTLLVVDYVMPGMNGAELIRAVQQQRPEIAVILATGYADMDKVSELVGAKSILKKPFRVEALAEAVHLAVA
jgi:CheY-like chemotaxis protein